MTAASYWSLLAPGIEMAVKSGYYGSEGQYAFGPVAFGFFLGGVFVLLSDLCLPHFVWLDFFFLEKFKFIFMYSKFFLKFFLSLFFYIKIFNDSLF